MYIILIGQNLSYEPQLEKAWDELQEKVCMLVHQYVSVYTCMHICMYVIYKPGLVGVFNKYTTRVQG